MSDPIKPSPRFVTIPGVRHRFAGRRPNGLEGAIIHFDAGRTRSRSRPDDLDFGARTTLASGSAGGLAFATLSRGGTVFLPENMDWERWGSHAGSSKCPATGRTAVSRFYVGIEVNCPGWVYPTEDSDLFIPWFDAVRDKKGQVVTDRQGRATALNQKGELYRRSELRIVEKPEANIRQAAYIPFTNAQMCELRELLLWLKARSPAAFRLDRIFGHDEVAVPAGRKLDPGGSLGEPGAPPLSMPAFRADLLERWGALTS